MLVWLNNELSTLRLNELETRSLNIVLSINHLKNDSIGWRKLETVLLSVLGFDSFSFFGFLMASPVESAVYAILL